MEKKYRTILIFIAGPMGVGKSTLGKLLDSQHHLGSFIDLDSYFLKQIKETSIENFFKIYGEVEYRKWEHVYLKKIINDSFNERDVVWIGLGGGTLLNLSNFNLIRKWGQILQLTGDPRDIWVRLSCDDFLKRPLLHQFIDEKKRSHQLLNSTVFESYLQIFCKRVLRPEQCDYSIDVSNLSPEQVLGKVKDLYFASKL